MKKWSLSFLLFCFVMVSAGCGSSSQADLVEGKTNVITSFYPLYDFSKKIGGEHVNVINLVPAGVEPHDWTPKSKDVSRTTKAELFVYQGAGFEGWVDDFIGSLKDSKLRIVEASKGATLIEGNPEHEEGKEDKGHDHGKSEDGHPDSKYDPHAWLSPKNAKKMAENIKNGLVEADPAHKAEFENNYKQFAEKLDQLDQRYRDAISKTQRKEIVVSHQAFGYLAHDYGLTQKAIMGLAPDAEPTARDLKEINDFVKKNQVKAIFFEELVSDKLAKTLAKDAGIETLVLNPLEGLTKEQEKAGEDYISIMDANLQNLLKALQ
ncbi:metal ABC transporter substrate-binding protein [Paenibacillus sp. MBLB4367]|uniref:metal ABC transporter substrate-binding protein n=1 Tax=Paenibacillus sp. MBLB4367 TaxID=3384767 RepID=UPI0039081B71